MVELWSIALVLIGSVMGAIGAIMFKKSSEKFSLSISGLFKNRNLIIGIIIYGLSVVIFVPALRGGELSVLYPIVSTSYIWTALLSVRFLGERMNNYKWLGIILIIIGISFIGIG
jgi:uncharacterized membrane protein